MPPSPKAEKPAKYEMPPPPIGPVHWFHVPGGEPSPAIVTRAGRNAVDVIVFPPDSRAGLPISGALHVGDPRARTSASPDHGFWDYTPEHKRLAELEAMLGTAPSK